VEDTSNKNQSGIKEFMCDYLVRFKKDNDLTYKDFKDEMISQGYSLTDAQLSKIFTKNGDGVSIEIIEKLMQSLDVMYRIEIYEREW